MKIIHIKLVNFIGVHAAMGLKEVEFSFDHIDKPIIQIYGKNRCGKTVLIQQLHPFSHINLNGDDRADLALIIPKEVGIKNIVYEVDGEVYNITHTYTPSRTSHTVSSSIIHNGEELNPSGGVTTFNSLIEKILGINKYVFQFIINGTQLQSFGSMSATQRKTLLNKAMGIDIYDKIHKLATDDYRYTNKLITSLNNTKEYILSTYGSYEVLCASLKNKQQEAEELSRNIDSTKSRMDVLYGEISTLTEQDPNSEMIRINSQLTTYENVVHTMGSYDPNMYDNLVQEQMDLNGLLNTHKSERMSIRKDIDVLYDKKNDIENTMMASRRAANDYDNMLRMRDDLTKKIEAIKVDCAISGSSTYYRNMIQPAQAINDICTEIVTCLNEHHLPMFVDMVVNGVDIAAFLLQEGSILLDSEKEKTTVSRIRTMIESIEGETIIDCPHTKCIHLRTHKMLETYFKSYQSATASEFTQYDLEQMEHAYKNLQTMKRLLNMELSDEMTNIFNLNIIMNNLKHHELGVDVSVIKNMMETAAKIETRVNYISQLNDINNSIERMKDLIISTDDMNSAIKGIDDKIAELKNQDVEIDNKIREVELQIQNNDSKRVLLSQIKHIDVNELHRRMAQLTSIIAKLNTSNQEYERLTSSYNDMTIRMNSVSDELKRLNDAYNQYISTVAEIEKHDSMNGKYKIIAEATSSTKGKPVIAIRETVEHALTLTNRLLDIMYDGEIELLDPVIDETSFTLPFRCGSHSSSDIKYGSQSESTLLSLALEMALSASLTPYNVCLVDEIDAALDTEMRDSYLLMLQETMATLKMEQMFFISHGTQPGQYEHLVHVIDLSKK